VVRGAHLSIEENIGEFDITMENFGGVDVIYGLDELHSPLHKKLLREELLVFYSLLPFVFKCTTVCIFHENHERRAATPTVLIPNYILVLKLVED